MHSLTITIFTYNRLKSHTITYNHIHIHEYITYNHIQSHPIPHNNTHSHTITYNHTQSHTVTQNHIQSHRITHTHHIDVIRVQSRRSPTSFQSIPDSFDGAACLRTLRIIAVPGHHPDLVCHPRLQAFDDRPVLFRLLWCQRPRQMTWNETISIHAGGQACFTVHDGKLMRYVV